MRPRTPREIAHAMVTTTDFNRFIGSTDPFARDPGDYVEFLKIHLCGVHVATLRHDTAAERAEASRTLDVTRSAIQRTLEEIGPELAAALAERVVRR